jgi:oligopeptide/dipeptide ABC transporter ATP-binding protein
VKRVHGSIRFGDTDIGTLTGADLRRYRGQVAMIFQGPRAHTNPVRRIGDFMTEALRTNLAVPAAQARPRALDMLTQVGIEDGARRLRQYPHQLSGGMLQRVMIAAALLTGPRLLLADEPTTALDVTTQAEVMAILDDLRRESGLAMLFITHDLELAAAICDRTVVMYAGQIVEIRASALLHSDPLHPYTAALAAARPDIAQTTRRLRAIPGRPLSAFEAPAGECAFAPRCAHARDVCRAAPPGVAELDGGYPVAPARANCAASSRRQPMAETGGAPVLEAAGLRKEFGEFVAVDSVSFSLWPGRSLAVVGESGSGKTTIARMLVGLERPTSGTITACGHDRSRPPGPPATGAAGAGRCRWYSRTPTPASTAPERPGRHRRDTQAAPRLARRTPPGPHRRTHRPGRPGHPAGPGATAVAVGWPAATSRDRSRSGGRPCHPDPGRIGRRAGCVDPGPNSEPARRHPRPDSRLLHPDQPQPSRGAPAQRRHARAAPRDSR